MNSGGFFRDPGTARASSAGRLLLGDDDGAMKLACLGHADGYGVGRVGLEVMEDALLEWRAAKARGKKLGGEDVRDALDVIARAGMAFDIDAGFAELLNPGPDGLALDADFFGDLRAADDDGGILGQKGEQGVNSAIRGAGEIRLEPLGHGQGCQLT